MRFSRWFANRVRKDKEGSFVEGGDKFDREVTKARGGTGILPVLCTTRRTARSKVNPPPSPPLPSQGLQ